jgi:hypothetical protein
MTVKCDPAKAPEIRRPLPESPWVTHEQKVLEYSEIDGTVGDTLLLHGMYDSYDLVFVLPPAKWPATGATRSKGYWKIIYHSSIAPRLNATSFTLFPSLKRMKRG